MTLKKFTGYVALLPIIVAALAVFLHVLHQPLTCDDAYYAEGLYPPYTLRRAVAGVWHFCNARFGDLTNYIWLYALPRWVTATLCAGMILLMFYAFRRLCGIGRGQTAFWSLCIAVIFTVCPWWDSFSLIVIQLNYTWAIALAATTLWLLFRKEMRSPWWLMYAPVACISGFGHEIVGIPMLLGVIAWCLWTIKATPVTPVKKAVIAAVALGAVISVSSPYSYHRMSSPLPTPHMEDPLWAIILPTSFIGLLLIADIIWFAISDRDKLRSLCRSLWLPLTVMAVASMVFVVVSNTRGRTGWVTQFFGVAALAVQLLKYPPRLRIPEKVRLLGGLMLSLLFAAQWGAVIYWQRIIDLEITRCLNEYRANPTEPVSGPIHYTHSDLPPYLMYKVDPNPLHTPWGKEVTERIYGRPILIPEK